MGYLAMVPTWGISFGIRTTKTSHGSLKFSEDLGIHPIFFLHVGSMQCLLTARMPWVVGSYFRKSAQFLFCLLVVNVG